MNDLIIEPTEKSPKVIFKAKEGTLQILGKVIPENPDIFFAEIMQWLEDYLSKPAETTLLELSLEYFNTSSSKIVLDILYKIDSIHTDNRSKVHVIWYYESDDPDMEDAGNDYKQMINAPFEVIPVDRFSFDF
jgi:hypothetical protein